MTSLDAKAIVVGIFLAILFIVYLNYDTKPDVELVVLPVDLIVELPITFDEWMSSASNGV